MGLGYDLRGVMYWTLVDNFEWGFGFSMRVGAPGGGAGTGRNPLLPPAVRSPSPPHGPHPPPPHPNSPPQFGMYRWENDGTQKRTPHKSVGLLRQWYEKLPRRVAELLQGRSELGASAGEGAPLLQPAA